MYNDIMASRSTKSMPVCKEVSSSHTISCIRPSDTVNVFVCTIGCKQAESFGTTILDEDGLLELIRTKPGKKSKYEIAAEAEVSAHIFVLIMLLKNHFITLVFAVKLIF